MVKCGIYFFEALWQRAFLGQCQSGQFAKRFTPVAVLLIVHLVRADPIVQTITTAPLMVRRTLVKTFQSCLKTIMVLLACLVGFSTNAPQAHGQFNPVMKECRSWSIEVAGKFYDRPTDDLGLAIVTDTLTNEVLLTSDQASDLNNGVGGEIKFNFVNRRSGARWEFRTFLANFDQDQLIEGANLSSVLFPTLTPEVIFTNYNSEIYSFELNRKKSLGNGVTCYVGPRFLALNEEFATGFNQTVPTPGGPFTIIGVRDTDTKNSFYGMQAGLDLTYPIARNISIQGFGRFGGYGNSATFTTATSTNLSSTVTTTEFTDTTAAFIGEIGGKIYVEIVPNAVSSFVGYEATWIDGVALAPAQFIAATGTSTIDTGMTSFFHALTFGLTFQY